MSPVRYTQGMGRPIRETNLIPRVRWRREQGGLSQAGLAREAGLSRQALAAIESGRSLPGVDVALRLAGVLRCQVEDLFASPGALAAVAADVVTADEPTGAAWQRARLARVGERTIAVPLAGETAAAGSLAPADGLLCGWSGNRALVHLLEPHAALDRTLLVAGCDPALPLWAAHFSRQHPAMKLEWLTLGTARALNLVRRGGAHVAGVHWVDPETGNPDLGALRQSLAGLPAWLVTFATWEEGLIVAAGNPLGLREAEDLARPGISIVNREPGSGARALLDSRLRRAAVDAVRIAGYDRWVSSHLAAAQAVAAGLVQAAVGVRSAARALGLEFIPWQRERFDLIVPQALQEAVSVQALLDTLSSRALRLELEAAGEYDTSATGDMRLLV